MADGRTARPVSGEILTGARESGASRQAAGADIVEADFEVVCACAQPGPTPPATAVSAAGPPAGGMNMLRRGGGRRPHATSFFGRRAGPAFWLFGAGLALMAFWVSGGHAWVRQLPFSVGRQAAGFSLSGIRSRVEVASGRPVLFVDGEAMNHGALAAPLPSLEINVTGEDGRVTLYKLGTSQAPLAPGGRFAFSSRLAVPKNGVRAVEVAFGE